MKDKLDVILDEFIDWYEVGLKDYDVIRKDAKSHILSLIRSCMPKKIPIDTTIKDEYTLKMRLERRWIDGFNSACDEMEKNIEGL